MKKFVLFLMCAAAFTFAQNDEEGYQEEESTQVEQTEEAAPAEEAAEENAYAAQSGDGVDYYAVDSVQIYNDLVEKFEKRGNKLRRPATPLIIAGSIGLGVGLVTMLVGEAMVASSCNSYDDYCDEDAAGGVGLYILGDIVFILGDIVFIAGAASLTTGIVLKIVGGTQLNRAKMYRRKAEDYERRSAYLRVVPTIDPINGRVGTLALLDF